LPTIEIAGESLFYARRLAKGTKSSLVLVHGAGGTHRHWGHQLRWLQGANLYALDLPGHGRSAGGGRASVDAYAASLQAFLEALGLTRAILAGHSMGGAIVQLLALEHSSMVGGLILVGTGARLRVLPSLLDGLANDFEETIEALLGYAYSASAPTDLVELGRQEWLANSPEVIRGDFLACDRFDVMDRLGKIHCPTLVLCGEEDSLTPPKYSHLLRDSIADAALTVIPDAGHMVMLEQPQRVNRAIEEFLQTTVA